MNLGLRVSFYVSFLLGGLGILLIFQAQNFSKTRLVFCDVGQGDAILIQSGSKQVVVDGGPGNKMVDCLSDKLPFWDRTVEMVVLTHPQRDHLEGLIEVLARYKVKRIVTTGVKNETQVFKVWEQSIKSEGAKIYVPDVEDKFLLDKGLALTVLWPDRGQIERWVEAAPNDLNETSIVIRFDQSQGCAYLTGDIPKEILEGLVDRPCQLLKISHHGSKTGTNQEIIDLVKPGIAIIQVGKNSFGHPHKEVIKLLESKGVKILRNDINGIIELQISSRGFQIMTER